MHLAKGLEFRAVAGIAVRRRGVAATVTHRDSCQRCRSRRRLQHRAPPALCRLHPRPRSSVGHRCQARIRIPRRSAELRSSGQRGSEAHSLLDRFNSVMERFASLIGRFLSLFGRLGSLRFAMPEFQPVTRPFWVVEALQTGVFAVSSRGPGKTDRRAPAGSSPG